MGLSGQGNIYTKQEFYLEFTVFNQNLIFKSFKNIKVFRKFKITEGDFK